MSAQIAHRPHGEQVCTGVFLILLATLCIVLMNACAKVSSVAHGPVEMVFYRGVVALGLLADMEVLSVQVMAGTAVVVASNLFILRRAGVSGGQ